MMTTSVHDDTLHVAFTRTEKLAGLVRDQRIPLTAIRLVEVLSDGLEATRGWRAPGLALPGSRKVGTWRSRTGTSLVAVHGGRPALRITLDGQRYDSLLITADTPEQLAASLSSHVH